MITSRQMRLFEEKTTPTAPYMSNLESNGMKLNSYYNISTSQTYLHVGVLQRNKYQLK